MMLRRLIVALLVTITAADLIAATKPSKTAAKGTNKPGHLTGFFDPTVKSLSPGFLGNSFERVYRATLISPKGEYETTAQFEERVQKIPRGVYAFRAENEPTSKYDADTGQLVITPETTMIHVGFDFKPNYTAYMIRSAVVARKEYVGSNAFGATALVKSERVKEYSIVVGQDRRYGSSTDLVLAMTPDEARRVRSSLKVLYVCSTDVPREEQLPSMDMPDLSFDGATGFNSTDATLDDPEERSTYLYSLRVKLLEIWVFDSKTGRVYGRFDPAGQPLQATEAATEPSATSTPNGL